MPDIGHDPAILLHERRKHLNPWKAALKQALIGRNVSDSLTIQATHPEASNLFEGIESHARELPISHPMRRSWEDITQFIRLHPNVTNIQAYLQLTPEYIDDLFETAVALEEPK